MNTVSGDAEEVQSPAQLNWLPKALLTFHMCCNDCCLKLTAEGGEEADELPMITMRLPFQSAGPVPHPFAQHYPKLAYVGQPTCISANNGLCSGWSQTALETSPKRDPNHMHIHFSLHSSTPV